MPNTEKRTITLILYNMFKFTTGPIRWDPCAAQLNRLMIDVLNQPLLFNYDVWSNNYVTYYTIYKLYYIPANFLSCEAWAVLSAAICMSSPVHFFSSICIHFVTLVPFPFDIKSPAGCCNDVILTSPGITTTKSQPIDSVWFNFFCITMAICIHLYPPQKKKNNASLSLRRETKSSVLVHWIHKIGVTYTNAIEDKSFSYRHTRALHIWYIDEHVSETYRNELKTGKKPQIHLICHSRVWFKDKSGLTRV